MHVAPVGFPGSSLFSLAFCLVVYYYFILLIQTFDKYGNHMRKDEHIKLALEGLHLLDKGDSFYKVVFVFLLGCHIQVLVC